MLALVIIGAMLFSAFLAYDFSTSVDHSLPSVPSIFSGTHLASNSVFFGSTSSINSVSLPVLPGPTIIPNQPPPPKPISNPPNSVSDSNVVENQVNLPPINPGFATFALCGNEQVVTSYDKTDMITGGDIRYVTVNPPSVTANLMFTNGTKIATVQNQNVNGCMTFGNLPINTIITVSLTGDYVGAMQTSTLTGYVLVSCYPDWKESVAYDQYGNVIQKFYPAIDHPSHCNLNYR